MTSFYYYDQNPPEFCFLALIRAFVIETSLGLQNLNMKGKTKRILVVVVKINDAIVQMTYCTKNEKICSIPLSNLFLCKMFFVALQ